MEVNDFEILLIDVTLFLQRVRKLVFNGLMQNECINYRDRRLKG